MMQAIMLISRAARPGWKSAGRRPRLARLALGPGRGLAPARLFALRPLLGAGELDHRKRRGVAAAEAELDHPRVAAVALLEARRNLVEQLLDGVARADEVEGAAARGQVAALAERDHPIGEAAQLLGLGVGGADALVADQAQHQVAEQRLAMG